MGDKEFTGLVEELCNIYLRCKRFECGAIEKNGYFKVYETYEYAPSGEFSAGFRVEYINGNANIYPVLEYKNTLSDIEAGHEDTIKCYAKKMRLEWLSMVSNFLFNYISFNSFVLDSYKGVLG